MSGPSCLLKSFSISFDERTRGHDYGDYSGRTPMSSAYPYEVRLDLLATAEFVSKLDDFFRSQGMDVPDMRPARGSLGAGAPRLPTGPIEGEFVDEPPERGAPAPLKLAPASRRLKR